MQPFDSGMSNAPGRGPAPMPSPESAPPHSQAPSQPPPQTPPSGYPGPQSAPPHGQHAQYPQGYGQPAYPPQPQYGYAQPPYGQPGYGMGYPQQRPAAGPSSVAGAIGIVFAFLASPPLALAIYNLNQAHDLATDLELPVWARGIAVDANLNRVLIFGGVAAALSLVGLVLALVGRRAAAGKAAIVFAALALAGSAYAQVGRSGFDRSFPPGKFEKGDPYGDDLDPVKESRTPVAPPPRATTDDEGPSKNTQQTSFRLGRDLGLSALGRARGGGAAADRIFANSQKLAKELGVTLPALPALSSDKSKDTADAMHYLLDTAGKPAAAKLSTAQSPKHAALFELGLKLNLLRLLYLPNDDMGPGLARACEKLAAKAGLSPATLKNLVTKATTNASQDDVGAEVRAAEKAIDRELGS